MTVRWMGVCLDCYDVEQLAAFYSTILGWEVWYRDTPETSQGGQGWISLRNPDGGIGLSFQAEEWYEPPKWPEETGALTKMMHFEISVDDMESAVAEVIEAGGSLAPWQPDDRDPKQLRIMLDPAGHPFCLCDE
jgi:catechol 2,3-dioxygenase-like lactoylglutathione lyase family enzyme